MKSVKTETTMAYSTSFDVWGEVQERRIFSENGIIYIGYDKKYIELAAVSAASVKKYSDIPCAIFTGNCSYARTFDVFDYAFDLTPHHALKKYFLDRDRMPSLKVLALLRSPFQKTLHLDSDTIVKKPIDEVFGVLNRKDIVLTNDCVSERRKINGAGRFIHGKLLQVTNPDFYNSGVFGYSNTPAGTSFIETWIKTFIKQSDQDPDSGNWAGVNDQRALNRLVKKVGELIPDIQISVLPNAIYNATGRMLVELERRGLFSETKIIHTVIASSWVKKGKDISEVCSDPYFDNFR